MSLKTPAKPIILVEPKEIRELVYSNKLSTESIYKRLARMKKRLGVEELTVESYCDTIGVDYSNYLKLAWNKLGSRPNRKERFGESYELVKKFIGETD